MNQDTDNMQYAKSQLEEARRRLDFVNERISEIEEQNLTVVIDKQSGKIVAGEDIEEIPEGQRSYRTLRRDKKEVTNIEGNIQNIIIDCQMIIELSVKSMFKAVGKDFERSHAISFKSGKTRGFNHEIPPEFPRHDEIVRAIFLTQLWEKFYQIAKYGAPELDVGPSSIFEIEDGERALNNASFCVGLAEDLLEFVEDRDID